MLRELGQNLTPFDEVRQTMLDFIESLPAEEVSLMDAWNRVLAEDLVSRETVPPFDNSAMDGYVLHAREIVSASEENSVTLPVAGKIAAGDSGSEPLRPGTAIRIMTGAPIPEGGDAVVPHELTRFTETEVSFSNPIQSGKNIRLEGGDMKPGDVPVRKGARLRGPQVSVAATLGYRNLKVARRPRVAILSPGKELVEPWETPGPGQIRNSNSYGLAALIQECGGIADLRKIIGDNLDDLRRSIGEAIEAGADVMISTGGVSAGDYDFVQEVVKKDGKPGHVFKTTMRPGKPQVFGLFDGVPLFGLPGNPAAAIVSFTIFVRPALRKMLGHEPWIPASIPVFFPRDYSYKPGRVFMLRARVEANFETGCHQMVETGDQDSSFLASMATANVLIQLPADRDCIRSGELMTAHRLHP